MLLVFAMLILLPASGMLWAMTENRALLFLAILFSFLSVIAVFIEETVAATLDEELRCLQARVTMQHDKIRSLDEAVREGDRILAMLEEQNNRVSAELISRSAHDSSEAA